MHHSKELNIAISDNLKLKSGILALIFGFIFLLQLGVIFLSDYFEIVLRSFHGKWIIAIGPGILFIAAFSELLSFRYIRKVIGQGRHVSSAVIYLIVFIETSFPTTVLLFVSYILKSNPDITSTQLLNSPPMMLYFVMIILSSLTLNYKISLFSGIIAAIEFSWLSHFLMDPDTAASRLDLLNADIKSGFIFVSSAIAGLVSLKIREAVLSSLRSKDDLIHKLDHMVHEKTEEIRKKKNELEEKNKDIVDSINYARRIQYSLMATEKYIHRMLNRLGNK